MNIKSLLIGSAAALAAVSGAQAADAIVAAEPEPMEYVRVCDAFGTGFFYIPGTETCLKIGGEVRVTLNVGDAAWGDLDVFGNNTDWASEARARVDFDARNDSEIGTIRSYIQLEGSNGGAVAARQAFIEVGGFRVGRFVTFNDDFGLPGESDFFYTTSRFNSASYTYDGGSFKAGLGVDDLSGISGTSSNIGLQGVVSGSFGAVSAALYGTYDVDRKEGTVAGNIAAEVGPGTITAAAAYSTGINAYTLPDFTSAATFSQTSEWTVGLAYAFKATDKLTLTAQANYYDNYMFLEDTVPGFKAKAWSADLLAEYKLAEGLAASANIRYIDVDTNRRALDDSDWAGFLRLTRSF